MTENGDRFEDLIVVAQIGDNTAWSFAASGAEAWMHACAAAKSDHAVVPMPATMHITLGTGVSQDPRSPVPYLLAILDFTFIDDTPNTSNSSVPFCPTVHRHSQRWFCPVCRNRRGVLSVLHL